MFNAFTEDGRAVVLFDNGTWLFKPDPVQQKEGKAGDAAISATATAKLTNSRDSYSIWYDPNVWVRSESDEDEDVEFCLKMKGEDGYALTIYERIPIPLEKMKQIALENMRAVATSAKVTEEKMLNVNGERVLYLRFEAMMQGMPFVYRGYYASGKFGTIQFLAYTHETLEDEYSVEMNKLLNGLRVNNPK